MKPHIVLIPGAWHSGDAYDTFLPFLHSHGYETTALTLPSVGAEPPLTSLEPEIEYIRGQIVPLLDHGQDVVVVMHSYGGFAGSSALQGLSKAEREQQEQSGGVISLVYLAAWMLPAGRALRGSGGGSGGKLGLSVLREEVCRRCEYSCTTDTDRVITSTTSILFPLSIMMLTRNWLPLAPHD